MNLDWISGEGFVNLPRHGWREYESEDGYTIYFDVYKAPNGDFWYRYECAGHLDAFFRSPENIEHIWLDGRTTVEPIQYDFCELRIDCALTLTADEVAEFCDELIDR